MDYWWEHGAEEKNLRKAFRSVTSNIPREAYRETGYSRDQLKYAFEVGFVSDNIEHARRQEAREDFFQMVEELGYYDVDDFNWEAWRDWYEETH